MFPYLYSLPPHFNWIHIFQLFHLFHLLHNPIPKQLEHKLWDLKSTDQTLTSQACNELLKVKWTWYYAKLQDKDTRATHLPNQNSFYLGNTYMWRYIIGQLASACDHILVKFPFQFIFLFINKTSLHALPLVLFPPHKPLSTTKAYIFMFQIRDR